MRQNLTNVGKKEQRQINQLLNKEPRQGPGEGTDVEERKALTPATKVPPAEGSIEGKDVEARTVPKQHRLKGKKCK